MDISKQKNLIEVRIMIQKKKMIIYNNFCEKKIADLKEVCKKIPFHKRIKSCTNLIKEIKFWERSKFII